MTTVPAIVIQKLTGDTSTIGSSFSDSAASWCAGVPCRRASSLSRSAWNDARYPLMSSASLSAFRLLRPVVCAAMRVASSICSRASRSLEAAELLTRRPLLPLVGG